MDKAKEALWTKSFVLDTLINFLVFLIYYLLIVIIAVVAKDNLHATAKKKGVVAGFYIGIIRLVKRDLLLVYILLAPL